MSSVVRLTLVTILSSPDAGQLWTTSPARLCLRSVSGHWNLHGPHEQKCLSPGQPSTNIWGEGWINIPAPLPTTWGNRSADLHHLPCFWAGLLLITHSGHLLASTASLDSSFPGLTSLSPAGWFQELPSKKKRLPLIFLSQCLLLGERRLRHHLKDKTHLE